MGGLSFPSAWGRLLEFERNGRSYMPGTILHTDHYNTVQRLAAMLLREAGNRIMQQFSQPVDFFLTNFRSQKDHTFGMKYLFMRRKKKSSRTLK